MGDKAILAFRDYDGTRQQTSFEVDPAATPAQITSLIDGLQVWSIGLNDGAYHQVEKEAPVGGSATSPIAQGSTQLILEMKDNVTGKIFRERLPMPDLAMVDDAGPNPAWITQGVPPNSLTVANPAHGNYVNLQTVNAIWLSPDGNAGTLQRAYVEE